MTTTPEQIEAVARALARANDTPEIWWPVYKDKAAAAINIMRPFIRAEVLEEAAKVAEGPVKRRSLVTGEVIYRGDDEYDYVVDGSSDYGAGRIEAAAAIRALKEKT